MNQPEKKVRQAASEFVSRDSNNSGKSEKDEEKQINSLDTFFDNHDQTSMQIGLIFTCVTNFVCPTSK